MFSKSALCDLNWIKFFVMYIFQIICSTFLGLILWDKIRQAEVRSAWRRHPKAMCWFSSAWEAIAEWFEGLLHIHNGNHVHTATDCHNSVLHPHLAGNQSNSKERARLALHHNFYPNDYPITPFITPWGYFWENFTFETSSPSYL